MDAEYKKAAEKLLCGITDKRLHEQAIWNDILSSVRSGKLWLWEINDEILRIKYFCKEKIERASAFTESDKSGVRLCSRSAQSQGQQNCTCRPLPESDRPCAPCP